MRTWIARGMVIILIAIVLFLIAKFVGKRDEYGYIGPNTSSVSYQYLMSGLNQWSSYLSGDRTGLSQSSQYFQRAIDQNQDTILGTILAKNVSRVNEHTQLVTISECLNTIRNIGTTRDQIDQSYNELFELLQNQITLVPTVLLSIKNLSTVKCVKNYVDQLKQTSMTLVEVSRSRGEQRQSYEQTIDEYPRYLGTCEQIMMIQQQSNQLQQDLADMKYRYQQYREILQDPSRHEKLCSEQYTTTLMQDIQQLTRPTLKQVGTNVTDAIQSIKDSMNNTSHSLPSTN